MSGVTAQFCAEYARHRAREGHALSGEALRALPYLRSGPLARQWAVRARSFDVFARLVLRPEGKPLALLDLGAGNGWLCHRAARMGHRPVALDMRDDDVDGLGAARHLLAETPGLFECVIASFDTIPLASGRFDVTLFNASLHYAHDLKSTLAEAMRVTRRGGLLAIMDSPFYARDEDGEAMIAEKKAGGVRQFGTGADLLLAPDFIEYLTRARLIAAAPALIWTRHPVRYPLWYELRPLLARLKGQRAPSRFDLWTARLS
ncbi:MAG TPA: class I SAM-dependent methyltransferase [Rhizomicrobium sp.]|jgi:SAM-dependent methyltransferase|nr:class I SAM-dependent methyltransferase [Rhizomicrobium sp.]